MRLVADGPVDFSSRPTSSSQQGDKRALSESEEDEIDIVGEQQGTQPMLVWGSCGRLGDSGEEIVRGGKHGTQPMLVWGTCGRLGDSGEEIVRGGKHGTQPMLVWGTCGRLWGSDDSIDRFRWWTCEDLVTVLINSRAGLWTLLSAF
jgi:hypothetical protein